MNDKTYTIAATDGAVGGIDTSRRRIELLAPAGDAVCLRAAVRAGADAVYLGMGEFNARRGAENFTEESLAAACRYAHLRGVKVYLTLNIVVLPHEMEAALETAAAAVRAGVDAFIVQDIGLAARVRKEFPHVALHVSTQMNTHNADGIRAAAALGARRVTLARELTLAEVAALADEAEQFGMQVECFAHGALCVCYSGQCLFSSMVGGRSANRGMCAQACRLPYELQVQGADGSVETLPAEGEHLLSPKDLCTIDMLDELVDAGVASLKIEGRMKSPEYVFAVVGVYRAVLNRMLAGEGSASPQEKRLLEEVFSRGFTEAYLRGKRGNDIMSYGRPNNRGAALGRLAAVGDGWMELIPSEDLHVGDVLEVWTGKGRAAMTLETMQVRKGGLVRIPLDSGNRDQRAIRQGDRVFRVRSAAAAFVDDPFEPRIPVDGEVDIRLGEPLSVCFWQSGGNLKTGAPVGEARGDAVETARTKELTEADVREHIGRFGNTPFELRNLHVALDPGCGLGFSALHNVRAQALEALEAAMLGSVRTAEAGGIADAAPIAREASPRPIEAAPRQAERASVVAVATNPACARAAKRAGAEAIYVPIVNYRRGLSATAGIAAAQDDIDQAGYPKHCIPMLPVVDRPSLRPHSDGADFDVWDYVEPGKPVFVESFGELVAAAEMGALPEAGPHLPIANREALTVAGDAGARFIWLSPELTLDQIRALLCGSNKDGMGIGITVVGRQELMVTEHCLLMSQGPCAQTCDTCPRRRTPHILKDRKGYGFPVVTDVFGRSHVYNSVPLDTTHTILELSAAGITRFMVDTTLMTPEEAAQAVGRAVRALDLAKQGKTPEKASGATTGHLFRGVS